MSRRHSEETMHTAMQELAARYANLFRAWGATGGKERAKRLTSEQRRAIARSAVGEEARRYATPAGVMWPLVVVLTALLVGPVRLWLRLVI